jgi:probable addiction module antidote protein
MMRRETKFSRYDVADYLKSDEELVAYLNACMDEAGDDAAYVAAALGDAARARGMTQLARDTEISREELYKALSSDGNPGLATVLKVMRALGLKLTVKAA